MTAINVLFLGIVVLAVGFFALNVQRLYRYLRIGRETRRVDVPLVRIGNLLAIGMGQAKILRDPLAGALHATVFWGFVVLTIGTVEAVLQGIWPAFSYERLLPAPLWALFAFSQDLFAVFVLAAVGALLYRRLVVHPKRLEGDGLEHGVAIFILSMIAALMITLVLAGAFQFVAQPALASPVRPVAYALSIPLERIVSPGGAAVG